MEPALGISDESVVLLGFSKGIFRYEHAFNEVKLFDRVRQLSLSKRDHNVVTYLVSSIFRTKCKYFWYYTMEALDIAIGRSITIPSNLS